MQKQTLAQNIFWREQRSSEIQLNFGRFEQLAEVYTSDIARLEAIEEAGFVLSLNGDKPCPLCGAPPDAQKESHGIDDIKRANAAANAEIAKIRKQQTELARTIEQLNVEAVAIERELNTLDERLDGLKSELAQLAPQPKGPNSGWMRFSPCAIPCAGASLWWNNDTRCSSGGMSLRMQSLQPRPIALSSVRPVPSCTSLRKR